MPLVSRATLPEEFFDVTSSMLLQQPEPQYLYAAMWKSALGASLPSPGALGLAGRQIPQAGAALPPLDSMRLMLDDVISSAAIKVVPELGAGVGHTVRVNRPYFADSTYTIASRTVAAGASISTTPLALSSEQVPLTLLRLAGPYGESAVQPYGIERFDATRGVHNLSQMVGMHLQRDFDKSVDSWIVALLDLAANAVYPSGMTAVNDATIAGAFPLDFEQLSRVEYTLENAKIPAFGDGNYVCALTPLQIQQLMNDSDAQRLAVFNPPANPLLAKQYYKTIGRLNIYKSQTLSTTANASSVAVQYGQAFGPGVLLSAVGELPRTAFSTSDNYGENALVIWLMYAAFGLSDNRFCVSVRSA
jgi:hypothetical protein